MVNTNTLLVGDEITYRYISGGTYAQAKNPIYYFHPFGNGLLPVVQHEGLEMVVLGREIIKYDRPIKHENSWNSEKED